MSPVLNALNALFGSQRFKLMPNALMTEEERKNKAEFDAMMAAQAPTDEVKAEDVAKAQTIQDSLKDLFNDDD